MSSYQKLCAEFYAYSSLPRGYHSTRIISIALSTRERF